MHATVAAARATRRRRRSGWAPAARCWPPPSPSTSPSDPRAALGRDVELVEVTTEGDRSQADGTRWPASAAPASSSARCATPCCAATSTSPCTRSRTCPTDPQERHRAGRRTRPRGPARRRRRPRRPHPRRAAGRAPRRHRLAATGRAARRRSASVSRSSAIRGNVDTRIGKVRSGEYDAVVLARAGLARLGRLDEVTEVLDPLQMLPAPGQGALAVECRARRRRAAWPSSRRLDDAHARAAVDAERAVLATLEAGCSAPVGALAEVVEGEDGDELWVRAVALSPDGALAVRRSATGTPADAEGVGAGWRTRCSPTERQDWLAPHQTQQTRGRTHDARQDHHTTGRGDLRTEARRPAPTRGWVSFVGSGPGDPEPADRACRRPAPPGRRRRHRGARARGLVRSLLGLPEPVEGAAAAGPRSSTAASARTASR